MFYIFGTKTYYFKMLAYKSEWCAHCGKCVLATKHRRLVMWHLFWAPLIPLSFSTVWRCNACGENVKKSLVGAAAMLIVPLFFILALFSGDGSRPERELTGGWLWGSVIFLAILSLIGLSETIGVYKSRNLKHQINPLNNTECLNCNNEIEIASNAICSSCGVMREGL